MNGHIKNLSFRAQHALKRHIMPGEEIALDEIYEQYKYHGFAFDVGFIVWLREIKLPDEKIWGIFFYENKIKDKSENGKTI